MRFGFRSRAILTIALITLLLAVPAMSVELFQYRGAATDGGTLEYVLVANRILPMP
jgi:hypothetical protein